MLVQQCVSVILASLNVEADNISLNAKTTRVYAGKTVQLKINDTNQRAKIVIFK